MMKKLLLDQYGIQVTKTSVLEGYISENYMIEANEGTYVLKVYSYSERTLKDIEGEIAITEKLDYLNDSQLSHTQPSLAGELLPICVHDEAKVILRLLSYIEGQFLAEVIHSREMFLALGAHLGRIDNQLIGFENTAIESRRLVWNLANFELATPLAKFISTPSKKKIVDHYILAWRQHVAPLFPHLRHGIIHNDANDWNVLVQESGFGLIDLGDSSFTALISELAITCSYGMMGKKDPVKWASYLVEGYHQQLPLEKKELDLLYYLIAARLVTSVCKSAEQAQAQPDKDYIQISEDGAWQLLEKLIQINPIRARNQFYKACGFQIPIITNTSSVVQKRHQFINKGVSISYKEPIQMDSAIFQYMFDKEGNRILDAYNNIPHVGHQHPKVVEAAQRQMAKLNTNTRYLYDSLAEYAEQLLDKFPPSLNKVYFVNSGSAASDLAIRLAQNYTQRKSLSVVEHGYHGNTRTGIEISPYKYESKGGQGRSTHIYEAPLPNAYRGKYRDNQAGVNYANDFLKNIEDISQLAAFIAEPIVGCGGQVPLADGYLQTLYPHLKSHDVLCISDEVQTGFGRMGSHFWGFELYDVVPDIVVLGKPLGNGHPMGAVVTTNAVADAFDNGMEFFSSFGGNPVSCEVGKAVLDVLEEEELQNNALEVGHYKKVLFNELKIEFPVIGDVRGSGLFLGIELIKDDLLTPNKELASQLKNELRNRNILVSTDGPYDSVIKTKPPMCFSKANADELIDAFRSILKNQA